MVYPAEVTYPAPAQPQAAPSASPAVTAAPGDGKLLIVGLRCGRLGNRIVLFANLIAYAAEHGYRLINVTFHSYATFFETTRRDLFCRYPIAPERSWIDSIPGAADLIRKTRIFYHVIRGMSVLNHKLPLFGRRVVTLRVGVTNSPRKRIRLTNSKESYPPQDVYYSFLRTWTKVIFQL